MEIFDGIVYYTVSHLCKVSVCVCVCVCVCTPLIGLASRLAFTYKLAPQNVLYVFVCKIKLSLT